MKNLLVILGIALALFVGPTAGYLAFASPSTTINSWEPDLSDRTSAHSSSVCSNTANYKGYYDSTGITASVSGCNLSGGATLCKRLYRWFYQDGSSDWHSVTPEPNIHFYLPMESEAWSTGPMGQCDAPSGCRGIDKLRINTDWFSGKVWFPHSYISAYIAKHPTGGIDGGGYLEFMGVGSALSEKEPYVDGCIISTYPACKVEDTMLSVSMWVYFSGTSAPSTQVLWARGDDDTVLDSSSTGGTTGNYGSLLYATKVNVLGTEYMRLKFGFNTTTSGYYNSSPSTPVAAMTGTTRCVVTASGHDLELGKWYHIVGTYDGQTLAIYSQKKGTSTTRYSTTRDVWTSNSYSSGECYYDVNSGQVLPYQLLSGISNSALGGVPSFQTTRTTQMKGYIDEVIYVSDLAVPTYIIDVLYTAPVQTAYTIANHIKYEVIEDVEPTMTACGTTSVPQWSVQVVAVDQDGFGGATTAEWEIGGHGPEAATWSFGPDPLYKDGADSEATVSIGTVTDNDYDDVRLICQWTEGHCDTQGGTRTCSAEAAWTVWNDSRSSANNVDSYIPYSAGYSISNPTFDCKDITGNGTETCNSSSGNHHYYLKAECWLRDEERIELPQEYHLQMVEILSH